MELPIAPLLLGVEYTMVLRPAVREMVPMAPHLYGELGSTLSGCEMLMRKGELGALYNTMLDDTGTH